MTTDCRAPSGTWGTLDDGDYRITLAADQVTDISYNHAAPIELGTFNVDTTPGSDTSQRDP